MKRKIICINKPVGHYSPIRAISYYGWKDENTGKEVKLDRQSMVEWIEEGNKAYVEDLNGNRSYCYVYTNHRTGNKFLQTHADKKSSTNLLNLKECINVKIKQPYCKRHK